MSAPTPVALRIPAKLNWTLEVLGRREDGFHELRSWFVAAARFDRLERLGRPETPVAGGESGGESGGDALRDPAERVPRLEVAGSEAAGVPTDGRNLVLRAEDAWREAGGEAARCRWRLHKEIPHGAGLGGGSGDAAAALHLLQDCATRALEAEALQRVATALGSDVPFFLSARGAQLRGGRGERRIAVAPAPAPWVVVAVPDFAIATAEVFAALDAPDLVPAVQMEATVQAPPAAPGPNELEQAAVRVAPPLADFLSALRAQADFLLSGSGGACYAPCSSEEEARRLHDAIANDARHCFAAPLLGGTADPDARAPLLWR